LFFLFPAGLLHFVGDGKAGLLFVRRHPVLSGLRIAFAVAVAVALARWALPVLQWVALGLEGSFPLGRFALAGFPLWIRDALTGTAPEYRPFLLPIAGDSTEPRAPDLSHHASRTPLRM